MKTRVKKLRVGIIGAGIMGRNHARIYSQIPHVELLSIADTRQSPLESISKLYKVRLYRDFNSMLEREPLDAVSVAVPTQAHFQVAAVAINKSIAVLIEKPFAKTVSECKQLIRQAKRKNIILGVGHIERFNPVVTAIKAHLSKSTLGRIYQIAIRRIGPIPTRITDVGVYLDLATHDLDIMHYLLADKILALSSESTKSLSSQHEDLAVSLIKFASGTVGVLMENWLSPTKIRDLYIHGENGMFVADLLTQDLYFHQNNYTRSNWDSLQIFRGMAEGNMIRYYIKREEPLKIELATFVDCVINQKPFPVTGQDGLLAVQTAHKLAYQAGKHK